MAEVTKQDVLDAYKRNIRKRRLLLYRFYKAEFFDQDFSASYISKKISDDLGIEIRIDVVYNINKYIKKLNPISPTIEAPLFEKKEVKIETIDLAAKSQNLIKNIPDDKPTPTIIKKNNSKF